MDDIPLARVAFLPDTFHEVNGVAHTSRHLEAFARRRRLPFLSVHAGPQTRVAEDGPVTICELARGPARFGLDANLDYDPLLLRHVRQVRPLFERFQPDLIHLTGPGDMGTLGCYLAHSMKIPLVISWHTSLHEYAATRLQRLTGVFGAKASKAAGRLAEGLSLRVLRAFYRQAVMVMAPNQELIDLTRRLTDKPVYLMQRGVDAVLYDPAKRQPERRSLCVGYVGRLTPEKNVRFLRDVAQSLHEAGVYDFELAVIGEGQEASWLEQHIPQIRLTGVLRGEPLARAYADMDIFVFPSNTDTFGNVILEAMASGVPCVVTAGGGPKFLVKHGVTGFVAATESEFLKSTALLAESETLRQRMSGAAREYALKQSWDAVFENVYRAYATCLPSRCALKRA